MSEKSYAEYGEEAGFVEGARVKVLRRAANGELGWGNAWVNDMDIAIGKEFTIERVTPRDLGFLLDSDAIEYRAYPWHVCELIAAPAIEYKGGIRGLVWDRNKKNAKERTLAQYLPKCVYPFYCYANGVETAEEAKSLMAWKHFEPIKDE